MRKFARGILVLLLVTLIGGVGSYFYEYNTIKDRYKSVAQLYIVPGEANEATLRAENGGLKDDFSIVFNSDVVLSAAKNLAGTSENIEKYLTVNSVPNSNIIELIIVNPDQNTAKQYVDAIAATAVKTTTIIPVESIQILSEGTSTGHAFKPGLITNTIKLTALIALVTFTIEMLALLIYVSFRKKVEVDDEYYDYEREFGVKARKNENKKFDNDYIAPNVSNDAIVEFDEYISKNKEEKTEEKKDETKDEKKIELIKSEAETEVESKEEPELKVEVEAELETEALEESKIEGETEALEESKVEGETEVLEESKVDGEIEALEESKIEGEIEAKRESETKEEAKIAVDSEIKTEKPKTEIPKAEVAANEDEVDGEKKVENKEVEVKKKKKIKIFGRVKK